MENEREAQHSTPEAKSGYRDVVAAHNAATEKGRVVPPYTPTLTLEQRVANLEKAVLCLMTPVSPQSE